MTLRTIKRETPFILQNLARQSLTVNQGKLRRSYSESEDCKYQNSVACNEEIKQQQFNLKNERETKQPSPGLPIDPSPVRIKHKPNTKQIEEVAGNMLQDCNEMLTPENTSTKMKVQEYLSTNKRQNSHNSADYLQYRTEDQNLRTRRKQQNASLQSIPLSSLYTEKKKSYRKQLKRKEYSIPYRKCYENFEGRIVSVLNKLQTDRNCQKDLQSLLDKSQNINQKDLLNRYVISGLKTTILLARQKQNCDNHLLERLQHQFATLRDKIESVLDEWHDYDVSQEQEDQIVQNKHNIMKSLYRKLKLQNPQYSRNKLKTKVHEFWTDIIQKDPTVQNVIQVVRNVGKISEES